MARILLLDSGPLGEVCRDPGRSDAEFRTWIWDEFTRGTIVVVPEVADYEVRRSLLRIRSMASLDRLDDLPGHPAIYLPITTATMRTAARLWAEARQQGQPPANDRTIDGDVILAAQGLEYCSAADDWWVVTENRRHLARYLGDRARPWRTIPRPSSRTR